MNVWLNKPRTIKKEEIRDNLRKVADLIIEEDNENKSSQTVGEWMEFFLKFHIFESLIAYAKSDKPPGFFNFSMNIIIEILENVEWISLISQKSVHPAINQMLQMFEVTIRDRVDFKYYSNKVILDFVNVLCHKIAKTPFLAHLLFTNTKRITNRKSEKGDYMPLKVVMRLLQDMTAKDDFEYWSKIYDTLRCILKMNNPMVDDYINNEGELCEILVNTLDRFYQGLPSALILSPDRSVIVQGLIKENFPQTTDKNNFYYSYLKFIEYVKFFDEWIYLTQNGSIVENIANNFFNDFLMRLQADLLLDDRNNLMRFRTTLQYLTEVASIIQHPMIYEMIFNFIFGFPEETKKSDEDVS